MDPLTAPSIAHPQTTRTRPATGVQRIAPGSMYLGRYREQCPGHWAQDPRFRDGDDRESPGAPRRGTARLSHVRSGLARTALGRGLATRLGRGLAVTRLRMVGVACRDPLRMVGVAVTPALRMMGVAVTPALRMVGVTGSSSAPAGLRRRQSRSRGGPALHRPAAIAARISARRYSA